MHELIRKIKALLRCVVEREALFVMSLISWIIPVYNRATLIHECLDSVLSSTWKDFEVIIVDDASTDHTLDICRKYEQQYEQVHVIHLEQNGGPGIARNIGMQAASGKWLFFLDSDDLILTEELPHLADKLYNIYDVQLVAINVLTEYKGQRWNIAYYDTDQKLTLDEFMQQNPTQIHVQAWHYFYERKFIENNSLKFYPQKYGEDTLFVLNALCHAVKIQIVTECLYLYRVMSNNANSLAASAAAKGDYNIYRAYICTLYDWIEKFKDQKRFTIQQTLNYILHMTNIVYGPLLLSTKKKKYNYPDDRIFNIFQQFLQSHKCSQLYLMPAGINSKRLAPFLISSGCDLCGFIDTFNSGYYETEKGDILPIYRIDQEKDYDINIPVLITSISENHGKMKKVLHAFGFKITN